MPDLAQSLNELAAAMESLRQLRHARVLDPLQTKLAKIFTRRWRKQQAALLKESRGWLRRMANRQQEADAALLAKLQAAVTARINAGAALTDAWPNRDEKAYNAAVKQASISAAERMTLDYAVTVALNAGNTYAAAYLRDHGFTQLASDIDKVTRERMANAVAEVYERGGSYDDAVDAIKETFSGMKEKRADMIARTELSSAYNSALLESARESADLLKNWSADGPNPCPQCIENSEQGSIALDKEFASGDDAPPLHPGCFCSVSFVRT